MKTLNSLFLIALLLISLSTTLVIGYGVNIHGKMEEAFEATYRAESMSRDINDLVESLNRAISLLEEGEETNNTDLKTEALALMDDVIAEAPKVGEEGRISAENLKIQAGVTIGLLAVVSVILWFYLPRLFWRLWINSRKGWKVKA